MALFGLWCIEGGESVLCEVDGGIYFEQVFTDIESAQAYAEQANADWTEQAQRHGWKGAATYFAAPLPDDVILPEPEPVDPPATKFLAHNPTLLASFGGFKLYEHPIHGDTAPIYMVTPIGRLVNTGFYDLGDFEEDGFSLCLELEADARDFELNYEVAQ